MDMSDMLDVIHYMFEEDIVPAFVENPQEVKSKVRSSIYQTLYERPYKNTVSTSSSDEFSEQSYETKPYIPPTDPSDFDKVLGAPMGG